jgi:hypothetical protein
MEVVYQEGHGPLWAVVPLMMIYGNILQRILEKWIVDQRSVFLYIFHKANTFIVPLNVI